MCNPLYSSKYLFNMCFNICLVLYVLFRLVISDNNKNNNNLFDLEAFLQVPIHFQINK